MPQAPAVTIEGVVMIDALGLALLLWILNLVRRNRLYVGYGVLLIGGLVIAIGTASVPPVRSLVERGLAPLGRFDWLGVFALPFIVFMFVYVLTQLSILSNRVSSLVQELAIRRIAEQPDPDEPRPDSTRT